jgi:phosphoglucomutase
MLKQNDMANNRTECTEWLTGNYDELTKGIKELQQNDLDGLADALPNLSLVQAASRGITMGIGTNRINKYTIGMYTQG